MSEQTCALFTLKDIRRRSGRWSQTSVCPVTSPPPMQSSSAKSRCLICLAGEPLILKSVGMGKRPEREGERDRYRLTARALGIFSPSSLPEGAVGSTLFLANGIQLCVFFERSWMHLFSNMRISLTRRLPGIYLNSF